MIAPTPRRGGTTNRPALRTSTELAQAVACLELDATPTLSRRTWASAYDVFRRVGKLLPKSSRVTFDRFDLETALDVLVVRGLAEAEWEDAQLTETRPQRYRWTKRATVESLERFTANARRCQRVGCEVVLRGDDGHVRYCSARCRHVQAERDRKGSGTR